LIGTGAGGHAYLRTPGALWHPGHRGFVGVALLGIVHLALHRLATEELLNNHIQRHSFVDPRCAPTSPVRASHWFRPAVGRTEWHRIARRLDYTPRLDELTIPVLILCGRRDPQFPPAASRELAAKIKYARVVWFERSGHSPFMEEPPLFWREVRTFLAGTASHPAG
jgi:pimeloyl-ACP methyl ester carboxylesterase